MSRAVWRLAWRELTRHRARSLLALLLVALPVAAISALGVVSTSLNILQSQFEEHVQATIVYFREPLHQDPEGYSINLKGRQLPSSVDVPTVVTPLIPSEDIVTLDADLTVKVRSSTQEVSVTLRQVDTRDLSATTPITTGTRPVKGEIALTEEHARELSVHVGDSVQLYYENRWARVTVAGIGSNLLAPNQLAANTDTGIARWIITGPAPIDWNTVKALNERGFLVVSAWIIAHPPPLSEQYPDILADSEAGAGEDSSITDWLWTGGLIGAGLIEMALLITPVFTVSAKRQTRSIALVAAIGATAKQQRLLVLLQGAILGCIGSVLGVGLGSLAATAYLRHRDYLPSLPWIWLLGTAALGVLLGITSAWFPARSAGQINIIRALSGRRSIIAPHGRRLYRFAFPALIVIGILIQVFAVRETRYLTFIGGTGLFFLGLIGCAPHFIALAARMTSWISLPMRLASREVQRSSHRTVPATAAILGATLVASMTLVIVTSNTAQTYAHQTRVGPQASILVGPSNLELATDTDYEQLASASERIQQIVGPSVTAPLYAVVDLTHITYLIADVPPEQECPLYTIPNLDETPGTEERYKDDPRCESFFSNSWWSGPELPSPDDGILALVDDGSYLEASGLLTDTQLARSQEILTEGGVILPEPNAIVEGHATVQFWGWDDSREQQALLTEANLPAVHTLPYNFPYMVLSPQAADRFGLTPVQIGTLVVPENPPDAFEADEIRSTIRAEYSLLTATVSQRRPVEVLTPFLVSALILLILIGAVLLVLALASQETRDDLGTLDAVGAPPTLRRRYSAAQSTLIALACSPIGILGGIYAGALSVRATASELHIPWPLISLIVLMPLLAALAGALAAPRLPRLARRGD
ncbi:MAG: FtsX-like permease family protein [Actinomycetaceae bacterium]|nr:FtsX-like permease family protein [Actinomycetaceae bacterium]